MPARLTVTPPPRGPQSSPSPFLQDTLPGGSTVRDVALLEPPERPQGSPASSSVWRDTILDAWGWCTRTTQRDGMGREDNKIAL